MAEKKTAKKRAKAHEKAVKKVAKADVKATHKAARLRDTPVMKVVGLLSEAADQPPLIAASLGTLAIGLATRRGDLARGGARMLFSHLLATGAKIAIKHQFDRTRPSEALERGGHRFRRGDEGDHGEKSFPSGHTAGAVAVARAASRDIDGVAVPGALAVGAVAAAQAPAGNHYFTDVIAGAVVGLATEAVVSAVFDYLQPKVEKLLPVHGEGDHAQHGGGAAATGDTARG